MSNLRDLIERYNDINYISTISPPSTSLSLESQIAQEIIEHPDAETFLTLFKIFLKTGVIAIKPVYEGIVVEIHGKEITFKD